MLDLKHKKSSARRSIAQRKHEEESCDNSSEEIELTLKEDLDLLRTLWIKNVKDNMHEKYCKRLYLCSQMLKEDMEETECNRDLMNYKASTDNEYFRFIRV